MPSSIISKVATKVTLIFKFKMELLLGFTNIILWCHMFMENTCLIHFFWNTTVHERCCIHGVNIDASSGNSI